VARLAFDEPTPLTKNSSPSFPSFPSFPPLAVAELKCDAAHDRAVARRSVGVGADLAVREKDFGEPAIAEARNGGRKRNAIPTEGKRFGGSPILKALAGHFPAPVVRCRNDGILRSPGSIGAPSEARAISLFQQVQPGAGLRAYSSKYGPGKRLIGFVLALTICAPSSRASKRP